MGECGIFGWVIGFAVALFTAARIPRPMPALIGCRSNGIILIVIPHIVMLSLPIRLPIPWRGIIGIPQGDGFSARHIVHKGDGYVVFTLGIA